MLVCLYLCLNLVFLNIYDVYIYTSSVHIFENHRMPFRGENTIFRSIIHHSSPKTYYVSLTAVSHTNVCLKLFERSTDQVCFYFRFMGAHCNPEVEKSRSAATDRFMFISNICLVR